MLDFSNSRKIVCQGAHKSAQKYEHYERRTPGRNITRRDIAGLRIARGQHNHFIASLQARRRYFLCPRLPRPHRQRWTKTSRNSSQRIAQQQHRAMQLLAPCQSPKAPQQAKSPCMLLLLRVLRRKPDHGNRVNPAATSTGQRCQHMQSLH